MEFLFEKVKFALQNKVLNRDWPPGSKIPSSRQLAKDFHCSVSTVEKAIKELEQNGLLKRESRRGTFVSASNGVFSARSSRSGIIAAIVMAVEHPSWATVIRGIEDYLHPYGYSLTVASHGRSAEREEAVIRSLIGKRVDGVILSPVEGGIRAGDINMLNLLLENGIKVIFVDRFLYGTDLPIPYVTSDNVQGAYKLTRLLIQEGHQRIVFARNSSLSTVNERWLGYKQALDDSGIVYDPRLDVLVPMVNEGTTQGSYPVLKKKLKELDFTAVFAVNDQAAKVALTVVTELGYNIPKDVSVVAYDAPLVEHPLALKVTGMSQPFYEMGKLAADTLFKVMDDREESTIRGYVCHSVLQSGNSIAVAREE